MSLTSRHPSLVEPARIVMDVATSIVENLPGDLMEAEVIAHRERSVVVRINGGLVVRVMTHDPEVHVCFQLESWESGLLAGEASFSNMPPYVVGQAAVAAVTLALGF